MKNLRIKETRTDLYTYRIEMGPVKNKQYVTVRNNINTKCYTITYNNGTSKTIYRSRHWAFRIATLIIKNTMHNDFVRDFELPKDFKPNLDCIWK